MAKKNNPIPKTQREISQEQIIPYDKSIGNPNDLNADEVKRSEQLSFKGDTVKPLSLGLQDIDSAIDYYFKEIIKPFVIQNGVRIDVPLVYGSPEKWKTIQKDGYFRDKNGKILSPLIVFKRDDLSSNTSIGNKIDANNPHLYETFVKLYSRKNFYSNFDILNDQKPEKEYYAVVIPDYVTINYSCIIYTFYNKQMNKIVEAINYASNSYWGDPARFKFNAKINQFNNSMEVGDGKDRAVKCNFTIKLYGYIIPDVLQKDMKAAKKFISKNKVIFGIETVKNNSKPSL